MNTIKWAICDDDDFFCFVYRERLKNNDRLEFCGYCLSAAECINMVNEKKPDVLLLDVQMETDTAGIDIIPELKASFPDMKIIILTGFNDDEYIYTAIANGANNYIFKDDISDTLSGVITDTYENKTSFSPEIANTLATYTRKVERNMQSLLYMFEIMSRLSPSEYEILKCFYNGMSYKEIARKKFIAESTVRNHITRLLKKFNMPSMRILINTLTELGLFEYLK